MDVSEMQRQFADFSSSLFREGYLDAQFTQLQQLQDETNPDFVVEVVSLFFDDSQRLLNDLTLALLSVERSARFKVFVCGIWLGYVLMSVLCDGREQENVDFKKVDAHVHQLKGSSSSIGAHRVTSPCIPFRHFCEMRNTEACRACLQQVKQEYFLVKNKLQTLLRMEQQILAAGGSIPIIA